MITFGNLDLNEKTEELVLRAIREKKIGQSEYIEVFEQKFADFLGVKYAVAVCNGTMADTIALAVLKSFYPNKREVLVPALTFVAQVNSIMYNNLIPVFYDIDRLPEPNSETLCVFPVHLLGEPETIVTEGVPVIEDACEALGSKIDGKFCGTIGDMGTFSFFPSHAISTGEGGMIVTNNEDYAKKARQLRNHAKVTGDDFKFDEIGFNGKMTSLQAMVGISLMHELPEILKRRHDNFVYMGGEEMPGQYIVPHGLPAYFENRDEKMKELKAKGVDCRRIFSSIPTQEKAYAFMGHKLGDFPAAEAVGDRGLYVPCHQNLTKDEMDYIKQCLESDS